MTPEEFEKLIVQGDAMRLAEAVAPLDESQRRNLSKTAAKLHREISVYENYAFVSGFGGEKPKTPNLDRIKQEMDQGFAPDRIVADLAVLAVGPLSQAKKASAFANYDQKKIPAFVKVLADRRPEWIDAWVDFKLQGSFRDICWEVLRPLIRQGVCGKPTSEGYVHLMANEIGGRWPDRDIPLSVRLLGEPDVLEEDVWRLFEVETGAFTYDLDEDQGPRDGYESWTSALVKLAAEGHVDRQRLLDASLGGLTTGFKNNTLTGYIRFHERLNPTLDEMAARQQRYRDLLSSQVSHVVTFALKMLGQIEKGGRLDGEAFLTGAGVVFAMRTKNQPKSVLKLAQRITRRQPELVPWALNTAIEALAHESADVQEQAVKLIEGWASRAHADHATILRDRLDDVAPTLRDRVQKLAIEIGGREAEVEAEAEPAEETAGASSLFERAESLDPKWRRMAGVDAAIEAIRAGNMPGPLEFDLLDVPLLSSAEAIEPIETLDELLDAVAHALESVDSADDLERILDGISRLCDQKPDDFQRRAAPLIGRMRKAERAEGARGLASASGAPFAVRQLVCYWLGGGDLPGPRYHAVDLAVLRRFIRAHAEEIVQRWRQRQPAPLLSAPTHRRGWIDPPVFVDRLLQLQAGGIDVPPCDLVLGLLRLVPDHRQEALKMAAALPDYPGRAVRWALGDEPGPTQDDREHASVWLAAGRARAPRGLLEELTALGFDRNIPDAVTPAQYRWKTGVDTVDDPDRPYHHPTLDLSAEPAGPSKEFQPLRPTVFLHERANQWSYYGMAPAWQLQWIATLWPLNCDPYLAAGIYSLMKRIDEPASTLEPNYVFLEPLLERDRPWSEMACLAAWIGLLSKDADARSAALDAVIEAVEDGRAHPAPMGDVLARIFAGGWSRLNRLADGLGEIARLSPLHAWFAAQSLGPLVASFDLLPRDTHHVLSLLLQLLTDLGAAPETAVCEALSRIRGSSKAAKSARALLALQAQPHSPKLAQAQAQLLQARIARAQRWS